MERMVRTRVQHVRGGRREPKCGMSAHGVSGALEARGLQRWTRGNLECLRVLCSSVIAGRVLFWCQFAGLEGSAGIWVVSSN